MALLSGKGQVKYHRTGRGKGQVKYHRKSKQKWKQGTGQISPGNRRLEFGDGRNWEAAFSPEPPPEVSEPADAPSVHTAIDSVPINSASRHGSPSSRRRPAAVVNRQPALLAVSRPSQPNPPIWLRNSAEPLMNSIRAGLNISAEQIKN